MRFWLEVVVERKEVALSRREAKSGRRVGREAARIPTVDEFGVSIANSKSLLEEIWL